MLDHIGLAVSDFAKSKGFFERALVPLGYADGVPRNASNSAEVLVAGHRRRIAGTVCMDQFVVDVGDLAVAPGDPVVLFGAARDGLPTATDWSEVAGTIDYEMVKYIDGQSTWGDVSTYKNVYTGTLFINVV